MNLHGKRVCVTGGAGFLGSHIVDKLYDHGCTSVFVPTHGEYDLRRRNDVIRMYRNFHPNVMIHAAAMCGGIHACSANPGRFLYDNLTMGLELMDVALEFDVEKFVTVSSVCAYPLNVSIPAKEHDLWEGYPESTNAPYGIAKRVLLEQGKAYRKQYGLNAIGLIPANFYGPRDHFEPERSHVIPSLINKFLQAKDVVLVWGSGKASREFLYVEDCAEAIVLATEKYNKEEPVNVATGIETSVAELVSTVAQAVGYAGEIIWDTTKPEGQPRRLFDTSRAKEFGFTAKTTLEQGLRNTLAWYLETQHGNSNNRTVKAP